MMRLTDGLKEPGLALVTALLVVVLVGALILGVFTTSVADYRIGRNLLFQEQALAAAEYGQNDVLRSWDTSWVHTMQPGNVTVRPVTVLGGGLDTPISHRFAFRASGGFVYENIALQGPKPLIVPYRIPGLPNFFARISTGLVWRF